MSDVKRLNFTVSQFESVVPYASEHGQYVRFADYAKLEAEAQALRDEVAALRARVVVVPDVTGYWDGLYPAQLRAPHGGPVGFYTIPMVRTDELARLNGKVVSEGLLRTLVGHATGEIKHLNNGLCPDDLEGHDTRDPDCAVCRALLGEGKEGDGHA